MMMHKDTPGRTPYGVPIDRISLGDSHIPEDVFVEFLQEISSRLYSPPLPFCVSAWVCARAYMFNTSRTLQFQR